MPGSQSGCRERQHQRQRGYDQDDNAEFAVTLSPTSSETVTVDYATVVGSASTDDYTGQNGMLTFTAGTTSGIIRVPTTDDDLYEGTENFTVKLSNASSGATIGDDVGIGTITDGDPQPTLSITDETVAEGGRQASRCR